MAESQGSELQPLAYCYDDSTEADQVILPIK